jgi:hypothetical protein
MKSLENFINESLNKLIFENLEKAKKALEKELDTQGFEVYIDDSGKVHSLVISVDELVDGGAKYPNIQKSIDKISKKFKLKTDTKSSNDSVVFLTESVSRMPEYQVYGKLSTLLTKYKTEDAAYKDSEKLAKKLGYTQDAVEFGIDYYFNSDNYDTYLKPGEEMKSMMESSTPNYKFLHERATSKAQRRLFAIALLYKRGNIEEKELDEEFADEIKKLSKLPEDTLKKFAKTKETKLPHYVGEAGENFAFSTDPLNFANFACAGTNVLAKQELMNWWAKQGLSEEQQEQAIDNIMKVMHGMYTNFYLGNPGRAYLNNNKYKPSMSDIGTPGKINR